MYNFFGPLTSNMKDKNLLRPEVPCSPVQWREQFTWKLSGIFPPKSSCRISDAWSSIMNCPKPLFQISVLLEPKGSYRSCLSRDGRKLMTFQCSRRCFGHLLTHSALIKDGFMRVSSSKPSVHCVLQLKIISCPGMRYRQCLQK